MISVCIPIYNYDIRPLVKELRRQGDSCSVPIEIVCIDDGSNSHFVKLNQEVESIATYKVLGENVGRAKVRNLFLQHTQGEWLLFLDNDCRIISKNFIKNYAEQTLIDADVIVGGRLYFTNCTDKNHRLRWLYGRNIESRHTAKERQEKPYRSFMTNNFLIRRDILDQIPFDERLSGYGHEDTLFGYRLKQERIKIKHIDNPVEDGDIEDNTEFLHKTQEAIKNLVKIRQFLNDPEFDESVRLLRAYRKVEHFKIVWAVKLSHHLTKRCLEHKFVNGRGFTLQMFSFYKLGLLCECLTTSA